MSMEAKSNASSQLSVLDHEVSVIQGHDPKSLIQTKAQGRTKAVTISVVPAVVSTPLYAEAI
jgi:hypothetical protein